MADFIDKVRKTLNAEGFHKISERGHPQLSDFVWY
jgi:hypothetical protein